MGEGGEQATLETEGHNIKELVGDEALARDAHPATAMKRPAAVREVRERYHTVAQDRPAQLVPNIRDEIVREPAKREAEDQYS